jgi:hypothetical protein
VDKYRKLIYTLTRVISHTLTGIVIFMSFADKQPVIGTYQLILMLAIAISLLGDSWNVHHEIRRLK